MASYEEELLNKTAMQPMYDPNRAAPVTEEIEEPLTQEQAQAVYASTPIDELCDMEIAQMVTNRKSQSRQWRQSKKSIWDICWNHMLQVYDSTGKESWQSKVFHPDTPKVIEIILANLHNAILSPDTPIEWQCKIREYDQNVRDINDIIKNDMGKGNFKVHFTDFLRGLCIMGTAVGKVGYSLEKDVVMVKERAKPSVIDKMIAMAMGKPNKTEEYLNPTEMFVKDWSTMEYRDLYKIFPEPNTTEIGKNHWIIEESKITNKELVDLANSDDAFFRLKNVTPDLLNSGGKEVEETNPDLQVRRAAMQQQATAVDFFDPDRPHILDEYWGPVPVWMVDPSKRNDESMKYKTVNGWIWVIDGRTVVRATLNPYRDGEPPYFKGEYLRIPGDWYGIGPAQLMMNLQINKNELINTKTDNVNLMLNQITVILKDKVPVDCLNRLKSAPGAMWLLENIDDVRKAIFPFQFPNLVRDIYLAIQETDRAIQEVTAAVSATAGVGGEQDQAGGSTFRGQMLNTQAAATRWLMYARVLESCGLASAYRKIYQRIYQYKSYESVKNILGDVREKTFQFIPPEQLDQLANLVPLGVMTMETKGVKLAQMTEYAKLWNGRPWFKEYDLARRMWVEMGYTDPDIVVFSPDEMKTFNEFRKSLSEQGNAGGGIPGGQEPAATGPIAGNTPPPNLGMPQGARPAAGPGTSPADMTGRPLS